jgi:CDP-glucose 4,6-dehydratase
MVDRDFWRGRSVLVTGHTGFKGGWLAAWLIDLGARVHGLALEPATDPSLFELARLGQLMAHAVGDLRDRTVALRALRDVAPEVVFHLAAQSLVRQGLREPVDTFDTNVMGTVHLLDAVRTAPSVRAVVVVTSDKCYEETTSHRGYREGDPLGGRDPYSASKGCQEIVTHAFRRSFLKCGVATARAGNVIGGGDWAYDRVIPDAVRALVDGRAVRLRNPGAVRPWQHVLEPLAGYLGLAERLCLNQGGDGAWNFGPDEADQTSVRDLVERLHRMWGHGSWAPESDPDAGKEASVLRLDASHARRELAWRPRLGLDRAVRLTVDWYRAVLERAADPWELTCRQIREYEQEGQA